MVESKWRHYLWSLAHSLVMESHFRVVEVEVIPAPEHHVPEEGVPAVIHLAKSYKGKVQYIRLVSVNQMWGSVIDRDIENGINRANSLKQRLRSREVEMLNVYLFPFSPPDGVLERVQDANRSGQPSLLVQTAYVDVERSELSGELSLKQFGLQPSVFSDLYARPVETPTEILIQELKQKEISREQEAKKLFNAAKPRWSIFFVIVNILMFLVLTANGGSTNVMTLIQYGAKVNELIESGQYWRLVTPMFLHIGFTHLLFNTMALYFIGPTVERIFGRARFVLIYVVAGILGTVVSFAFTPSLAAGASGAIFGCFGALLVFGQKHRALFFQTMGKDILFFLGLNLMIGFVLPGIDNSGHIGGLIGGYLIAATLGLPNEKGLQPLRAVSGLLLIALFIGALYMGFTS